MKKEIPKQEAEIKKMEEKLLNWKYKLVTGSSILMTGLSVFKYIDMKCYAGLLAACNILLLCY